MTPEQFRKVKDLFLLAADKPRDQQDAYIAEVAGGDPDVQREVQALLAEHNSDQNLIPEDPHSPMSSLLSRAGVNVSRIEQGEPLSNPNSAHAGRSRPGHASADTDSPSRSGFVDPGRFTAGTVVANRYRIIELLGRGGMGEVYRADDIKLAQTVALKFLPRTVSQDTKWLERFHNEVRIARQVSHPNVCRVFDIGEFEGEQFISMEYIDGENLSSLLRRIGRIPYDKALQIAKQLCAGLTAAHDKGVLHRDLKPANVMIDGRGQVRITDFGLAAPIDQIGKDSSRAGTPAYMSPEQLAGKAVTIRSDVYSLGLLLYEMFTGRPTFKGDSLRDYIKLHTESLPDQPSSIVNDLNPDVERVILRCLEKDPRNRPASVLAVVAAFPGGNTLREILAAGQTPSPEVVAAAGGLHHELRPAGAIALLAAALIGLVAVVLLAPQAFLISKAIREKPPAVLTDKARDILNSLGYNAPAAPPRPADSASGFGLNAQYYVHIQETESRPERWKLLVRPRPGLVYFWYRQSPDYLMPLGSAPLSLESDPPLMRPGMINLRLDPRGRLIALHIEPHRTPAAASNPAAPTTNSTNSTSLTNLTNPPDWSPLLHAVMDNADLARFHPVAPERFPPMFADARAAWEGSFAEAPTEPLRLEAAACEGKIVYFTIVGPWKDAQISADQATVLSIGRPNLILQTVITLLLLIAGSYLAWQNYKSGRGDRLGATRMGLAFLVFGLLVWIFRAHHIPDLVAEFTLFTRAMGEILYPVALIWIFYLALEPYVRRVWPETVISWSRLLSGKWSDPLVGRDALLGALVGIVSLLITQLEHLAPRWLGQPAPMPIFSSTAAMLHSSSNFSTLFASGITALYFGLILLLFLVLARILTRRKWLACTLFVLVIMAASARWNPHHPWLPEADLSWIAQAAIGLLFVFLLTRYGLVATMTCILCRTLLLDFPISPDFNVWYAPNTIVAIVSVLAILGISFYTTLGGRPLFNLRLLET